MNGVSVSHQRGAVTLIGALFLIFSIIVLLGAVQRMAASSITDSALHNDGIEALFIAESGLERAAWRFAGGSACTALAGETGSIGRGSFLVQSAGLVGAECRVQVSGSVTTTIAVNTVTRTLEGDLVASGSGVWAVGNVDGGETIINRDGSSWSRAGPYGGIPDENLNSVYCITGNDCWAVGNDAGGELIIHGDGSSWSRTGPYGGIPDMPLNSVHCVASDDCWAVGDTSGGELIIHWNGSSWSRAGPYGGIPDMPLNSVHCVAVNDCWAVGDASGGELIIHWDGSNWSRSGPNGSIPNENLQGVYCVAASDCWAVGIRSGYENINHWDGSAWSRLGNTPGIPNKDLHAVYMVSATEGYLVGEAGTIASWDGSNWSGQSSPTGSDLNAVFAGGGAGGGVALVHWSEVIQ